MDNSPQRGTAGTTNMPSVSVKTMAKSSQVSLQTMCYDLRVLLRLNPHSLMGSKKKKKKFGLSSVYGLKELIEPACRVQYMWSVEKNAPK